MSRKALLVGSALALVALVVFAARARAEEETWDGLTRVESKKLQRVYLLKGADFRTYTKVLVAAPQVSFRKDWARDANRGVREPSRRITDADVKRIQGALAEGFQEILAADFAKAGWGAASAPGPDVLQLTPVLLNVDAAAPATPSTARLDTYTVQAGEATVALEVRDAETGMLLGRAVDRKDTASVANALQVTDRVTNRADFEALLKGWSRALVDGLAALKAASPLGAKR
jgi:hypothetical protein